MKKYAALDIVAVAIKAGRKAMEVRKNGLIIDSKPDGSKVTNADMAADKALKNSAGAAIR